MVSGERITSICRYLLKLNILCANVPDVSLQLLRDLHFKYSKCSRFEPPPPPPPTPLLGRLTSTQENLPNPYFFYAGLFRAMQYI